MEISSQAIDQLIYFISDHYSLEEIKGIASMLNIRHVSFIGEGLTYQHIASNIVDELRRHNLVGELITIIKSDAQYKRTDFNLNIYGGNIKPLNEIMAKKFGDFFTALLKKFSELEENQIISVNSDIDSVPPVDFQGKMRDKAKFSVDIINYALEVKPDISVLQRKAKMLKYKEYGLLIRKVAYFYTNVICDEYPPETYSADVRYRKLHQAILDMLPISIIEEDDDIESKVSGIIFDALSKCLIFNN